MRKSISGAIRTLLDCLFVPKCVGCGVRLLPHQKETPLCDACRVSWEAEKRIECVLCHQPHALCHCTPPVLGEWVDCVYCFAPYDKENAPITHALVLEGKEHLTYRLRQFLAQELCRLLTPVCADDPPVLTYVPRNPHTKRRVGYDQSEQLCKSIGDCLGLATQNVLQYVPMQSGTQKERTRQERFASAQESYFVKTELSLEGKTVWLVDDVLTTGATVLACAKALKSFGAQCVCVICCGKTPKKHKVL